MQLDAAAAMVDEQHRYMDSQRCFYYIGHVSPSRATRRRTYSDALYCRRLRQTHSLSASLRDTLSSYLPGDEIDSALLRSLVYSRHFPEKTLLAPLLEFPRRLQEEETSGGGGTSRQEAIEEAVEGEDEDSIIARRPRLCFASSSRIILRANHR